MTLESVLKQVVILVVFSAIFWVPIIYYVIAHPDISAFDIFSAVVYFRPWTEYVANFLVTFLR